MVERRMSRRGFLGRVLGLGAVGASLVGCDKKGMPFSTLTYKDTNGNGLYDTVVIRNYRVKGGEGTFVGKQTMRLGRETTEKHIRRTVEGVSCQLVFEKSDEE